MAAQRLSEAELAQIIELYGSYLNTTDAIDVDDHAERETFDGTPASLEAACLRLARNCRFAGASDVGRVLCILAKPALFTDLLLGHVDAVILQRLGAAIVHISRGAAMPSDKEHAKTTGRSFVFDMMKLRHFHALALRRECRSRDHTLHYVCGGVMLGMLFVGGLAALTRRV